MLDWVVGNAQQLPFPDNSMDAYTIAFGIRNCTDVPAVLREVLIIYYLLFILIFDICILLILSTIFQCV